MKNEKNTTKYCHSSVGAPFAGIHRRTDTTVPYKIKNIQGITLIALVVIIIILLILAGVVINLTLGEHGILKQAQQGAEQYKISEILEKLELEKVDLYARKNGVTPNVQEYIDHLINKEIITSADVTDIDANSKNIAVEGYTFLVEKEANGNIKITYQGKADNKPRIANLQVTGTTVNNISVKVVASNADGASYKYSIKNITLGETTFTEVTTLNTNEYTFTGLTINNEYVIQVELITSKGTDTKETNSIKTEPPKVTTITLDKTNIELIKGGTDIIIATVLPANAIDKTITWTSSNEAVVTVDNSGNVTSVGEGVAIITVTSNEVSTVTATCNITVTPPPPPSAGAGGKTHTAKQIQYTWEELNSIAKVISDNYGEEEGKINNDTAEVNVSINGKSDTLGIGDWTTVNGKQVRILGFNHDPLTDQSAYGENETNTYAGISFEYIEYLITERLSNQSTNTGGWGKCTIRSTLNNTTINSLENKEYIKSVSKQYIATYNVASSVTTSQDKLWLLSCSEIWNDGFTYLNMFYGCAIAKEGEGYKYYKNINAKCSSNNTSLIKKDNGSAISWWLRSPTGWRNDSFGYMDQKGVCSFDAPTSANGGRIIPGFAI